MYCQVVNGVVLGDDGNEYHSFGRFNNRFPESGTWISCVGPMHPYAM